MRRRVVLVVALAVVLLLAIAAQAFAAVTVIDVPDAAYLAGTTKIDISAIPIDASLTSITDGNLTVSFNHALFKGKLGITNWPNQWGTASNVEAEQDVDLLGVGYYGSGSLDLVLDKPATTFGFELATFGGTQPYTATFIVSSSGTTVGTVTKTIPTGEGWGARLFAIASDVPFDKISVLGASDQTPRLAQFRYVLAPQGTPVSVDIGGEYGDACPDTYIYSYRPTGFFGNSTADFVGRTAVGEERTVISIPLDKLDGVDVSSATLDLTKSNGTLFPLRAYRLRPDVVRATWNEYAVGSAWAAAGANDAAADFFATPYAASSDGDFDVTALLEAAIADGEDSLDLVIVDPAPVDRRYVGFYASDCVNPPWRPCLEVEGLQAP